ncbi:hypothetical protein BDB01DRAFT_848530 [Pilobolus umbonatus]|nr:hypothetical protein BDB01DRAFT_848530 [Pilobolus umbonatus]
MVSNDILAPTALGTRSRFETDRTPLDLFEEIKTLLIEEWHRIDDSLLLVLALSMQTEIYQREPI